MRGEGSDWQLQERAETLENGKVWREELGIAHLKTEKKISCIFCFFGSWL
jgi:hypothetical protein